MHCLARLSPWKLACNRQNLTMSKKNSKANNEVGIHLSGLQTLELLRDVEKLNKSRQSLRFVSICDRYPNTYGESGSLLRRAFQTKWSYFKKLPIDQYVSRLKELKVQPSDKTYQELGESQKSATEEEKKEPETKPEKKEPNGEDASDCTPPDSDEEYTVDSAEGFGLNAITDAIIPPTRALSKQPTKKVVAFAEARRSTPTPTHSVPLETAPPSKIVDSSTRTPLIVDNKKMSVPDLTSSFLSLEVTNSSSRVLEGTKENPFVIYVDLDHPERNREFEVFYVTDMVYNEHTWNSVYIHRSILPGSSDYTTWEAQIPKPEEYTHIPGPKVLIKGVSRDFWLRNVRRYHSHPRMGPRCKAFIQEHNKTYFAVKGSKERKMAYWILVFPSKIVLDNSVLAGEEYEVPTEMIPLTINHEEEDDDEVQFEGGPTGDHAASVARGEAAATMAEYDSTTASIVELESQAENEDEDEDLPNGMLGMIVFWRIVVKGSSRRAKNKQRKQGVKDLFSPQGNGKTTRKKKF